MHILLEELLVTQNGLRDCRQVAKMIEFVGAGGFFTRDARLAQHLLADGRGLPPPMHIAVMEDDRFVLHDGHHRAVAMFLGGRPYVDAEKEAEVVRYAYADYAEAHPEKGWFTPFNLETEVRLPDFGGFKKAAILNYKKLGRDALNETIRDYRHHYVEPRRVWTVAELAEVYREACRWQPRKSVACAGKR